MMLVFN